eukprot:NODE_10756_length_211_cov_40.339506_g10141_i0.p2 GENE.NODE_10756_length_211_cov_40.339506_g10141_i0~~NODE_10756_length_211_cov_40.339506_g10141_i0.p2  ORF type:complete len:69 (-),score=51.64 NODE_10756_length_211_cov_40.339506_g10141_i0:4-180(-)
MGLEGALYALDVDLSRREVEELFGAAGVRDQKQQAANLFYKNLATTKKKKKKKKKTLR